MIISLYSRREYRKNFIEKKAINSASNQLSIWRSSLKTYTPASSHEPPRPEQEIFLLEHPRVHLLVSQLALAAISRRGENLPRADKRKP